MKDLIMKKIIPIVILLWIVLFGFFQTNKLNYRKYIEIQKNFVDHPENLPTKEVAKNTAFWFKNLKADLYWLQTIQYIGWNAISSDYKKYLYIILDLITELNPYFEHAYTTGQLLLPSYNHRYEELGKEEQMSHIREGEKLWLKWIQNFCDPEKIELIKWEFNLQNIWTQEKYKNPCKSYTIPYYLAYIYYYYKKEPLIAANYYKIASANEDALEWSRVMAAIMQWKWGQREKSYFMFLNIAKFIDSSDKVCNSFASTLENIWVKIFLQKDLLLSGKLIQDISDQNNNIFWKFDEEQEDKILSDTKCINYVSKSIRELNLAYIEQANEAYKKKHNWVSSINAKQLYDQWYLEYLPVDFQQYENYGIIYEYNDETWNYDYKMGNYDS
jgi:hypothetical protein